MADAAHELRTPLTALHLQLGALGAGKHGVGARGGDGEAVGRHATRDPARGADAGAGAAGAAGGPDTHAIRAR